MDPELQNLVNNSASIKGMAEKDRAALLAGFEKLREDGLQKAKEILIKERSNQEAAANAATLSAVDIKSAIDMLHGLEKKFKSLDMKTNNEMDRKESGDAADAVLGELDKVLDSEEQEKKKKKKLFGLF